jgi:hypothetical protein
MSERLLTLHPLVVPSGMACEHVSEALPTKEVLRGLGSVC